MSGEEFKLCVDCHPFGTADLFYPSPENECLHDEILMPELESGWDAYWTELHANIEEELVQCRQLGLGASETIGFDRDDCHFEFATVDWGFDDENFKVHFHIRFLDLADRPISPTFDTVFLNRKVTSFQACF